jgi:hypothetical protein
MTIEELKQAHTEQTEAIKQKSSELSGSSIFRRADINSDLHLMHFTLAHIENELEAKGFKGVINGRWVH